MPTVSALGRHVCAGGGAIVLEGADGIEHVNPISTLLLYAARHTLHPSAWDGGHSERVCSLSAMQRVTCACDCAHAAWMHSVTKIKVKL